MKLGGVLVDIAYEAFRKIRNRPKAVARRARKAAKRPGRPVDETAESFNVPTEVSMNQQVVVQIVYGVLRHAMTAAGPLGVALSDNAVLEIATVLVSAVGLWWMGRRKVKAAE